jgi:hypothetical protein
MKILRSVLAGALIVSCFGIAAIDYHTPGSNWKTVALGIIYGVANVVIFVFKD